MCVYHDIMQILYVSCQLIFSALNTFSVYIYLVVCNTTYVIQERQDLSEALLVQGEMREHQRYVEEGNVFPVQAEGNFPYGANSGQIERNDNSNSSPRASVWKEDGDFFWNDNPTLGP